ncbi:SRPBCC family protein [Marinifilum caeruleilacunae]|uniref:Polyketide cyclase n=1 Tax=Marinifilum caeruleilacunae TaxID=2499076 RepID=A0ABX1WSF1_9BACT|nr:SRPBCC family protein [Marinifilum caeruleilacunae]NOU58997.1 polyketide cyclase [Marinifilum caeruleilacunae]
MKTFLYIIGAIVLIVGALHFMAPKTYQVDRKIVVNQEIETVFKSLCSLKEQQIWSPWAELDPEMKVTYNGTDGSVGSFTYWIGNKDVGEGEQEIIKIEPNSYIETELRFMKPFESTSTGYFELKPVADGTEITWGLKGDSSFPTTLFMVFMDMDENVGPDFEKGLAKFKAYIEK